MISSTFGITLLTHIAIISATRIKKILNFAEGKQKKPAFNSPTADRAIDSLAIACITELVIILVIASSLFILGEGIKSDKSNYKILQSAFKEFENKSIGIDCILYKKCGSNPPDANIPVS